MTAGCDVAILAGGQGTRLRERAGDLPKPMVPLVGRPILDHQLDLCRLHGFKRILLLVHYNHEAIRAHVGDGSRHGLSVEYAVESTPRGTAGALSDALPRLADTFLVVYADNASQVDLRALLRAHRAESAATLGLFRVPDPHTRGIVEQGADGTVVGFIEKPERPKSNLAWAGLLVGTPELMAAIPEKTPCDLGHDVLPRLLGRMRGLEIDGYHRDVGTPESYRQACDDLEKLGSAA